MATDTGDLQQAEGQDDPPKKDQESGALTPGEFLKETAEQRPSGQPPGPASKNYADLERSHSSQLKADATNPYTLGDPSNPLDKQKPANDEWTGEGNNVPHQYAPQTSLKIENPYAHGDPANVLGKQHQLYDKNPDPGHSSLAHSGDELNQDHRSLLLLAIPIALLGGLLSIPVALIGQLTNHQPLMTFVGGPVIEEIAKPLGVIWLISYRPRWLVSPVWAILFSALGGLIFASVENLIYIHIYVPDGTENFQAYRWTVCTGLHVLCSTVFGLGLAKSLRLILAQGGRFQIDSILGYFTAAAVIHGVYNFTVTLLSGVGWMRF